MLENCILNFLENIIIIFLIVGMNFQTNSKHSEVHIYLEMIQNVTRATRCSKRVHFIYVKFLLGYVWHCIKHSDSDETPPLPLLV